MVAVGSLFASDGKYFKILLMICPPAQKVGCWIELTITRVILLKIVGGRQENNKIATEGIVFISCQEGKKQL